MNPIVRRVRRLLILLFADIHQREAARQIGITHSLLSRTLSGERKPSKTLLEKLGSFPGVNLRWLLDGIGEPLLEGGTSLPVITELPKSADIPWRELTSETETYRVPENQFSDTRYWWRLTKVTHNSWGKFGQKHMRAQVGDYLLMETERRQIETWVCAERPAIISHADVENGKPRWGILTAKMQFRSFNELADQDAGLPTASQARSLPRRRKIRKPDDAPKHVAGIPDVQSSLTSKSIEPILASKSLTIKIEPEHIMAIAIELTSSSLLVK
jgi:transcriptional regulator with XRE-family HTH domain